MRGEWVMVFRVAAGLALAVFLVGGAQESPAFNLEEKDSPFGVVDHTLYDVTAQLGAIWMRHPEAVYHLEDSLGVWEWTWDPKLDEMEARGLNFAPVMVIGKCWMSGFTDTPVDFPSYPPTDLGTVWSPATGYSPIYYDFIYTLLDRYRGRVDHMTIENEVNAPNHWAEGVDKYVRVLKTAYLAAHNADPNFMVFDSGIGSGAWGAAILRDRYESGEYTEEQLLDFANDYYARDVYTGVHFETLQELVDWLYSAFVADQYERTTYLMANMRGGLDALNLKFTEYYWLYDDVISWIDNRMAQAGYAVDFKCNNEASNWIGVPELQEARELVQKYVVGASLGIDRTIWFPLSWELTPSPRYALLDSTGDWMLTAHAFRNAARIIGHEFQFDHLDASNPNVLQYVFQHRSDAGHHLRVCWFDNGDHTPGSAMVRFNLPPATYRFLVSDCVGTRTTASILGEEFVNVTVTEAPVLVEYFQDLSQVTGFSYDEGTASGLLGQNYPNPFNPTTGIPYVVPGRPGETALINLTVYDVQGNVVRRLVDGSRGAGRHTAFWSGERDTGHAAPPGVYLVRLRSGSVVESRKMILAP